MRRLTAFFFASSATALVLACVGDDPGTTTTTTTTDASSTADTSTADTNVDPGSDAGTEDVVAPPCDLTKGFGAPVLVPGVNTAEDDSAPTLTADEKTIYFTRVNGPDFDIYVATRADRNAAFGTAQPVPGVNANGFEGDPFVTTDGKLFFMSSVRTAPGTLGSADIFFATRDAITGVIGSPTVVPGVNSSSNDGQGYLVSGTEIFFVSARADASAPTALYRGDFASGSVSNVAPIAELNTPFSQSNPIVSPDGMTVYFATTRVDVVPASSGNNIWSATRTQMGGSFGTPAPVEPLNSDKNEYPRWISPDGCRLYLQSDRPGIGKLDIYVAERPPK